MRQRAAVLAAGFVLDLILGDPYHFPHPVRWIGSFIGRREKTLRNRYPKTEGGELAAGVHLVADVLLATGFSVFLALFLAGKIHGGVRFLLEAVLCYQMLAARSLKTESMKVYEALKSSDIERARKAVSMIVGRDTEKLSGEGMIRAAVETVAENTSDGIIGPIFYMALGGIPLMVLYKAVNTMDSMVGYRNETYLYFGKCAARLDDLANLIPARIAGLFMVISAWFLGLNGKGAWRIFLRDRYNHKSPNSAQTEAACAGALGVRLAGDAWYVGTLYKKPFIGDDIRPVEAEDIPQACRLMYATTMVMMAVCLGILWNL